MYSAGNVSWICVRPKSPTCDDEEMPDLYGFRSDREKWWKRGKVTFTEIRSSAKAHNITGGGWMSFSDTGPKIDNMWTTIATAVHDGRLQTWAKVSPDHGNGVHILVVHNDDFTNEQRVNMW